MMSDRILLENTSTYLDCHEEDVCCGGVCSLHRRTTHHMRKYRQHWRADRLVMERICEHGLGHPDPDDYTLTGRAQMGALHACDGCCALL